jgi:hypothetical protein
MRLQLDALEDLIMEAEGGVDTECGPTVHGMLTTMADAIDEIAEAAHRLLRQAVRDGVADDMTLRRAESYPIPHIKGAVSGETTMMGLREVIDEVYERAMESEATA